MKPILLAACLALLPAVATLGRAAETNGALVTNPAPQSELTAAERRARIETWRETHNTTNAPAAPSFLGESAGLSPAERRARIRAKLDERREHLSNRESGIHPRPASPATNPPPVCPSTNQ